MRRFLAIGGATLLVLILIGSFVVYPAVAADQATDQVRTGLDDVADAAGVQLENVTIDVGGGNAFTALTGGAKVGDIKVSIGRIVLPEGATAGQTPAVKPGEEAQAEDGVRDVLDTLEDVGSFEFAVGEVVSGEEKLQLNNSSVTISDGGWGINLRLPKKDVDELLAQAGFKGTISASGQKIRANVEEMFGEKVPKELQEPTEIEIAPAKDGKAIAFTLDGKREESPPFGDGFTINQISFSSDGSVYGISLAGSYDYDAARAGIERELKNN